MLEGSRPPSTATAKARKGDNPTKSLLLAPSSQLPAVNWYEIEARDLKCPMSMLKSLCEQAFGSYERKAIIGPFPRGDNT